MAQEASIVQKQSISKGELRENIISIAWPAVTELILISLLGAIDMIMVGRIGPSSIAAIGLTNQPIFLAMAIFQALNIGGTAIVARAIGAENLREAKGAVSQLLILTNILSILVVFPAMFFAREIYIFMGADGEVIQIGLTYFKIVLFSIFFQNISLAIAALLRGSGDTKTPMKFNIFSNIVNIVGNYILIFGPFGFPALGVTGAGWSTLFSKILSALLLLHLIYYGNTKLRLSIKSKFQMDYKLMYRIIKIGLPSALEQLVLRGGNLFFVKVVAGLGTIVYASHQVALTLLSFSFTTGMAFAMAASTLVGQSLGARDSQLAEAYGKEIRFLGSIISTAIGAIFFVFGPQVVGLFSTDTEVIQSAALILKMIALIQTFQSSQLILAGALRGAGDTKWPLYSTIIGIWGIRISLAYLFVRVFHLGLIGAWLGICIDQVLRYFILLWRFKKGRWKHIKI